MIIYDKKYEATIKELHNYKILDSRDKFIKHFGEIFPEHIRTKNCIEFKKNPTYIALTEKTTKEELSKKLIIKLNELKIKYKDSKTIADQDFYILLNYFSETWFDVNNIIYTKEKQFKLKVWGIIPKHLNKHSKKHLSKSTKQTIKSKPIYSSIPKNNKIKNKSKSFNKFLLFPIILIPVLLLFLFFGGMLGWWLSKNIDKNLITNNSGVLNDGTFNIPQTHQIALNEYDLINSQWKIESEDGGIEYITFLENNYFSWFYESNPDNIYGGDNSTFTWVLNGNTINISYNNDGYIRNGKIHNKNFMSGMVDNNYQWNAYRENFIFTDSNNYEIIEINSVDFYLNSNDSKINNLIYPNSYVYKKIFYNSKILNRSFKSIFIDVKIFNNGEMLGECEDCETKTAEGYTWSFKLPINHSIESYQTEPIGSNSAFDLGTIRYEFYFQDKLIFSSKTFRVIEENVLMNQNDLTGKSYEWHYEWGSNACSNMPLRTDGYVTFLNNSKWTGYDYSGTIVSRGFYELNKSTLILTFDTSATKYTGKISNQNLNVIKGTMQGGLYNPGQTGCFEFILK